MFIIITIIIIINIIELTVCVILCDVRKLFRPGQGQAPVHTAHQVSPRGPALECIIVGIIISIIVGHIIGRIIGSIIDSF